MNKYCLLIAVFTLSSIFMFMLHNTFYNLFLVIRFTSIKELLVACNLKDN